MALGALSFLCVQENLAAADGIAGTRHGRGGKSFPQWYGTLAPEAGLKLRSFARTRMRWLPFARLASTRSGLAPPIPDFFLSKINLSLSQIVSNPELAVKNSICAGSGTSSSVTASQMPVERFVVPKRTRASV